MPSIADVTHRGGSSLRLPERDANGPGYARTATQTA